MRARGGPRWAGMLNLGLRLANGNGVEGTEYKFMASIRD